MSDNATWLLREQQLKYVNKSRRSYVNFEKSNCSRPPTHWALHFSTVQVKGVFIHSNSNKFSGYITVPMRLRDVRPMMHFLDKAREMKYQSKYLNHPSLALPRTCYLKVKIQKNTRSKFLLQWHSYRTLLSTSSVHVQTVTQDALVRECEVYCTTALTLPQLTSQL